MESADPVAWEPQTYLPPFYIRRKMVTGRRMIASTRPRAPFTATPANRNGSKRSHTRGYKTSAASASGQHKKRRMSHNKNFAIRNLLL